MRLLVLLAVFTFVGTGCSSTEAPGAFSSAGAARAARAADEDDAAPAKGEASGHVDRPPSRVPTDTSGTRPTPPTATGPTTWRGRLETSPMVNFGGGKWCDYHVVLSAIELSMTLDADGHITATDLSNTMTETATACDAQPLGVQQNTFVFRKAGEDASPTLTVSVAPDPNNLPQADVTLVAEVMDPSHIRARLLFHRTGAVDNVLNWRDTVEVDLAPESASLTNEH